MKKITSLDALASYLSLAAILFAALVGWQVFENIPHLEDEITFVWQARLAAGGQLTIESPPHPGAMMVPFVIDYNGQRFGKYPPGWPVVLAFGERWGLRSWINPLLAGLAIWLTYRLGSKLLSRTVGLLAAVLTLASPFFLLNSGSLLSHPWALVLSLVFALAWLDTFGRNGHSTTFVSIQHPAWMTVLVAGLSLGILALTRPLTAVGVAIPFFIHGLILLWCGDWGMRRLVLVIGGVTLMVTSLLFVWQFVVTGDPLTNPYTLWWPYDKIGFGPGFGNTDSGHNLHWLEVIYKEAMRVLWNDLFGWRGVSWLFLPFGLWAIRRNRRAWLVGAVFPMLVLAYVTYWVGANSHGPRYYYEAIYSLTILTAAGIDWLWREAAGLFSRPNLYRFGVGLFLAFLVGYNLIVYLPERFVGMNGIYDITLAQQRRFQVAELQEYIPALVFVHIDSSWTEYGGLLDLQDPWLTSPLIFALTNGEERDRQLQLYFPERQILHYYPALGMVTYDDP